MNAPTTCQIKSLYGRRERPPFMETVIDAIENQIARCEELIQVFQEERERYQGKEEISLSEVISILKNKQRLVSMFEEQKTRYLAMNEEEVNGEDEERKRELMGKLSSLLEQLLVIDQENELLLRDLLNKNEHSHTSTREKTQQESAGTNKVSTQINQAQKKKGRFSERLRQTYRTGEQKKTDATQNPETKNSTSRTASKFSVEKNSTQKKTGRLPKYV